MNEILCGSVQFRNANHYRRLMKGDPITVTCLSCGRTRRTRRGYSGLMLDECRACGYVGWVFAPNRAGDTTKPSPGRLPYVAAI